MGILPLERSGCCFGLQGPPKLCWMIHTGCNLRCRHCAVFENPFIDGFTGLSSREEIDRVLDFIRANGIGKVVISGGEPTLSPWLRATIEALAAAGTSFSLSTNATTVTSRRAGELRASGLTKATVSLDGAQAATHDELRGAGAWSRAQRGITALVNAGVAVSVGVFLRDGAATEAAALASGCVEVGASRLSFFRPIRRGRYASNPTGLDSRATDDDLLRATATARARGLHVTVHAPRCDAADCPSGTHVYGAIGGKAFDHCVYKNAPTKRFTLDSQLL